MPLGAVLGLSAVLFGIGVFGFLARRNIILMLVSVEVMLNAVNLSLAAFSWHWEDPRGQVLALFVIAVAAAEVARPGCGVPEFLAPEGRHGLDDPRITRCRGVGVEVDGTAVRHSGPSGTRARERVASLCRVADPGARQP